ncbi:hypothetical protein ColTof4_13597 [Colletotrichum tofieldiae]|nr:hypothetical protein ColTof3_14549 [Colletotrichum tofieldiae]GKT81174.1 hypothetical protein ColTof4_13597 [Colletotrichum tofieldiae]GKT97314.1 hypothetical protein Ct61P_15164 [Colletotrichum tofieldiae]
MLGMIATATNDMLSSRSPNAPMPPIAPTPLYTNRVACLLAMMRLTKIMYQKRTVLSKHGKNIAKVAAMETLMKAMGNCYTMSMTG